jgi:hypothetical protein
MNRKRIEKLNKKEVKVMKKLSLKAKRVLNYSGLFLAVFGITATAAYFMIPSNVKTAGTQGDNTSEESDDSETDNPSSDLTPTQLFVAKLASGISGIKADVSLNATLLNSVTAEDGTVSYEKGDIISINNTPLYFTMPTLDQISLAFNPTIVYSTPDGAATSYKTSKDLSVTLLDKTLYLSCLGVNYKCSIDGLNGIIARLQEDPFDLVSSDITGKIANSLNSTVLTDALGKMTYLKKADGSGYTYDLTIPDVCTIFLESDNDYNITKAYANDINIKNLTDLSFYVTIAEEKEIANDIVEPSNSADYLEFFNTMDLVGDVYSLVKTPSFGISGSLNMTEPVTATHTKALNKDIKVTVDANANITDKLVGADVTMVCGDTTQSLGVDYLNAKGAFVNYNDALQASMSYSDLNLLLSKMKSALSGADTSKIDSLFGFITKSEVMTAISSGHYQKVVDMISKVEAKDNYLNLSISLKGLGLGDNSTLVVKAEDAATTNENVTTHNLVAGVSFSDIQLKQFTLSGAFDYKAYTVPSVDETKYTALNMMPTVWDQAYALYEKPQAAVTLTGSVMDHTPTNGVATGFTFKGSTEFDISAKKGTGEIAIVNQTEKFQHTHNVAIDVQGDEAGKTDGSNNAMLFTYGSSASSNLIKGKNTIKTLNDIIDTVKTLMNSTDERYTKFFDPLKEASAATVVGMLISGNYSSLVENKILTSVILTSANDGSQVATFTLDKKLLGTLDSFTISLGFASDKTISSLSVAKLSLDTKLGDTELSKDINVTLTLGTYDGKLSRLSTTDTYMDFSQVSVLLQLGINTSEFAYWHLTANASVSFGLIKSAITASLDFYIHVNGKTCEVIGYVNDIPTFPFVNGVAFGTRYATFIYKDEKIYVRGRDTYELFGTHNDYDEHYYTAKYFTSNILKCICGDILGLAGDLTEQIEAKTTAEAKTPIPFENVLNEFSYYDGSTTASASSIATYNDTLGISAKQIATLKNKGEEAPGFTANKLWTIDTNIGVLARNDQLKTLNVQIGGSNVNGKDYLTSAHIDLSILAGISIKVSANIFLNNIGTDYSARFTSGSDYANLVSYIPTKASLQA